MNGKIEVGCWAVIYKPFPCCGTRPKEFGIPFIVEAIDSGIPIKCDCPRVWPASTVYALAPKFNMAAPLEIIKRIDPPAESEERETERELAE